MAQQVQKWKYTQVVIKGPMPSTEGAEKILNELGLKGWEAYAATEFRGGFGTPEGSQTHYLKRPI